MADTPAERVFEIRKALGDGRYPLSQTKLAAMLRKVSGKKYDGTMITKMEKDTRRVSAQDATWLAAVDPLHRGAAWVLCLPDQPFQLPPNATNLRSFPDPDAATPAAEAPDQTPGKAGNDR